MRSWTEGTEKFKQRRREVAEDARRLETIDSLGRNSGG
jgi:hypothetical protein